MILQQNNRLNKGLFKRYVTFMMALIIPFNFATHCQFYSITTPVIH